MVVHVLEDVKGEWKVGLGVQVFWVGLIVDFDVVGLVVVVVVVVVLGGFGIAET